MSLLESQEVPEEAVDKIRKAGRLGNKKLANALAAVAAGLEAAWTLLGPQRIDLNNVSN